MPNSVMALNEDDDFSVYDATSHDSTWIRDIEAVLEDHAMQWDLVLGEELFSGLKGYLVDATTADGTPAVIKLRRPDHDMRSEVNALRLFNGQGTVRLLDTDDTTGAMLLEKVVPGTRLASDPTTDVDVAMLSVLQSLPSIEPDGSVTPLAQRAERWAWNLARFEGNTPIDASDLKAAARDLQYLAGSQSQEVVLHGDLHVENVLRAADGSWIAVDPKGFAGERLFDAAWWLRDPPSGTVDVESVLRRRLSHIQTLPDFDTDRALAWARSCATLATASRVAGLMWDDAERHARCAVALRSLR